MILRTTLDWGRVMQYVGKQLAAVACTSVALTVLVHGYDFRAVALPNFPISLYAASLGIFLGFRNNSAYDRWWEARNIWGTVVNASRTLVRQSIVFGDREFAKEMASLLIAFVHSLRLHLRRQDPTEELKRILSEEDERYVLPFANRPNAILTRLGLWVCDGHKQGLYGENRLVALEATLARLTDCLGGCERIKNTPMIRQYDYIPKVLVYGLIAVLPFALVANLGWYTAPVAVVVSFLFLSLDTIGRNVEAPFESTINDIPMTALSTAIEIDLLQMLGEREGLPEPVQPVEGILY
ncbi:MAG: bestrophin family protein [Fimbriimonas sp.]